MEYVNYIQHFQPKDIQLDKLQKLGNEFGATTQRKRQCDWLNLNLLLKSIHINGVTDLIINKCDIIESLNYYKLYFNNKEITFETIVKMKEYIVEIIPSNVSIIFSSNKFTI